MTENEFIHIVPQLRQITLQISQGYGVGCDEAEDIAQDAMLKLWAIKDSELWFTVQTKSRNAHFGSFLLIGKFKHPAVTVFYRSVLNTG